MHKSTIFSQPTGPVFEAIVRTAILILVVISANALQAHNGAITYVYPVSQIQLDADFDDWPSNLTRYPIEMLEVGVAAENKSDLQGNFRIGYDPLTNNIYLAVEVIDQSIMLDTTQNINWDTHDGMELYLDPAHSKSVSNITQYSLYADRRMTFGKLQSWDGVEVVSRVTSTGRVYEWQIDPGVKLEPGKVLAFDLVVIDKDQDDSYSWVSWGKNSQKLFSPNNCGDLVIGKPGQELIMAKGTLDTSKLVSTSPIPVRFTSTDNPDNYISTLSDSLGSYHLTIPAGSYYMQMPAELMQIDNRFYRIAENTPVSVILAPGNSITLPILKPEQHLPDATIGERGILHTFDADQQQQLDDFIETYKEFYAIPGVSLAIIKNGELSYYKTYGVKDANSQVPVTEETLFEAASITKPVFAYAVLSLYEKGIIDLDKPLYQYLPFEALEEYPEYKKMTARHVLIHRTGLPNWGQRMERAPGLEYGYSGEGFEYLKRVVVEITGKDIEEVLEEELINPLGLYHMEFKDSEKLRAVVSSGHLGNHPTGWGIPKEPGMAFSMHTEAKAFTKFALALLHEEGLKKETFQEMTVLHTESNSEYWDNPNYKEGAGLGVHVRESEFGKVIGHGGNNGDFKCLFEVYQELDMGYVIFTNSNMGDQLAGDLSEFLVEGATGNMGMREQ